MTSTRRFDSHDEAVAYVASRPGAGLRIVSDDALTSCVPLEALDGYRKIYGSSTVVAEVGGRSISSVEVWEWRSPEARRRVDSLGSSG